ncbi:nuclear transport factor 2 family protein [Sphaerisporangium rubeum]|uniref:Ketosteroid isomerase-like protein n=2 Tax=Sphaerisporangium rubeum TaxID=321317 RepID=A0A7X0IG65_9ACTN|nr:nuclear transport factor 2 family protein [Sphaerisporangium rubeum]MBB6474353.1 ketosteroid isomerase-like protein [Sphaerisporangium rubeum]
MSHRTTEEVIACFNQVVADHDPRRLAELVADDCVMEAIQPAPDGARTVGRDACIAFWEKLASDRASLFEPEEVIVSGDRGRSAGGIASATALPGRYVV